VKIVVCYNYPIPAHGAEHAVYASRFVSSYRENPPLADHEMIVISSGGSPSGFARSQFSWIHGTQFIETDDEGWDCGNYIKAARHLSCDMIFCCGGGCHFRRLGWLKRIVEVWKELGPGMYGTLATYEHGPFWRHSPTNPHINTTGFAIPPSFLRLYPSRVITREDRYEFEHGPRALWRRVEWAGLPVRLVTWGGVYTADRWREPVNGYRSGDQSDCLTFWGHTDEYESAPPNVKLAMKRASDGIS
jgi:hypothetical protein